MNSKSSKNGQKIKTFDEVEVPVRKMLNLGEKSMKLLILGITESRCKKFGVLLMHVNSDIGHPHFPPEPDAVALTCPSPPIGSSSLFPEPCCPTVKYFVPCLDPSTKLRIPNVDILSVF